MENIQSFVARTQSDLKIIENEQLNLSKPIKIKYSLFKKWNYRKNKFAHLELNCYIKKSIVLTNYNISKLYIKSSTYSEIIIDCTNIKELYLSHCHDNSVKLSNCGFMKLNVYCCAFLNIRGIEENNKIKLSASGPKDYFCNGYNNNNFGDVSFDTVYFYNLEELESNTVTDEPSGKVIGEPSGKVSDETSGKVTDEPSGKVTDEPSGKIKAHNYHIANVDSKNLHKINELKSVTIDNIIFDGMHDSILYIKKTIENYKEICAKFIIENPKFNKLDALKVENLEINLYLPRTDYFYIKNCKINDLKIKNCYIDDDDGVTFPYNELHIINSDINNIESNLSINMEYSYTDHSILGTVTEQTNPVHSNVITKKIITPFGDNIKEVYMTKVSEDKRITETNITKIGPNYTEVIKKSEFCGTQINF